MMDVDYLGLGQIDGESVGDDPETAADYLRARWADFTRMGPRIIDLQHRAALIAGRAREAGDMTRYEQARAVIRALGRLGVLHGKAVDKMRGLAEYVGLAGWRDGGSLGLGAIPVAVGGAVIALALTVAYFFRAYAAESRKLDMIEAGTLTAEQAIALDRSVGSIPSALGELGNVLRLALFAAAAFGVWRVTGGFKRNPPLVIFDKNPPDDDPDVFGEEVYAVWYRHADDGRNYVHDFGPGVELAARPDGSVELSHRRGRRVWEEF